MSDLSGTPARPVSLFTIVFLFAIFAAFLLVIRYFYQPSPAGAFNAPAENISKDLAWRESAEARRKTLREQQEKEAKQRQSYGWADQKAGVVQLPIERAMELTAQDLASKQPARKNADQPAGAKGKL
jgi:F0F1-type ATP synthase membrane subunit b/b'